MTTTVVCASARRSTTKKDVERTDVRKGPPQTIVAINVRHVVTTTRYAMASESDFFLRRNTVSRYKKYKLIPFYAVCPILIMKTL